jgi:hypothetical protein
MQVVLVLMEEECAETFGRQYAILGSRVEEVRVVELLDLLMDRADRRHGADVSKCDTENESSQHTHSAIDECPFDAEFPSDGVADWQDYLLYRGGLSSCPQHLSCPQLLRDLLRLLVRFFAPNPSTAKPCSYARQQP